jgi:hypothetical protein
MKKFKVLKNKFKKFLKKNKKLVNFVVKFFIVLKFVLDVVDLVLKVKDLCPWLDSLVNQLNHEVSGYLAILFKNNINEKPLAIC